MASSQRPAPFFTIVLPVHGVERYIANALSDLQAQTFTDWEAVVVDDATPDTSEQIAQGFAERDGRFRIVRHAQNTGLAAARNTGLAVARGRYVTFFDPDDRFDPQLLEQVHASLQDFPAQAVLFGHVEEYFDTDESLVETVDYSVILDGGHWVLDGAASIHKWVLTFEKGTHYGYAWNKFYERELLERHALRFEDDPLIEDIAFNVAVFDRLESLNLVELPLYRYAKRDKGGSLTSRTHANYYELHRKRIELLAQQQRSWGLMDDQVRELLGSLMARYAVSAIERKLAAGEDDEVRAWLQDVFDDPLYQELVPHAHADSRLLNLCYKPLREGSVPGAMIVGRLAGTAKRRAKRAFHRARRKR